MALVLSAAASPSIGTTSTAHIQPNPTLVNTHVVRAAQAPTEDSTVTETSTIFEVPALPASIVTGSPIIITSLPGATDSLYPSSETSSSIPPAMATSSIPHSSASPKLSLFLGTGLLVGLALLAAMI